MTHYDIIIVGGGFAGIYSAWCLAREGRKVVLIEASDHLGGAMWSWNWNGYLVDRGTHNFDLRSPIGAAFYEDILAENLFVTDSHDWASTTGSNLTYGFEMPDFAEDDPAFCKLVLAELAALHMSDTPKEASETYVDLMRQTYGPTLASRIAGMLEKVIGGPSNQIAAEARGSLGMFARPKLGTDAEMIALKQQGPFYDDRLGVTLDSNDTRFMGRSTTKRIGYPAHGALRSFCIQAEARLRAMGVTVLKETCVTELEATDRTVMARTNQAPVSADRLFWTLPEHSLLDLLGIQIDLKSTTQPVGMAVFAFEVPVDSIRGPDYLHDFSIDRLPYRYNRCGLYSGQVKPDGTTFVMAEVPSHPSKLSEILTEETKARVWSAMQDACFVKAGTAVSASGHWGYPVAFTLPKLGWQAPMQAAKAAIRNVSGRFSTIEFGHRGRHSFMTFYHTTLQHELKD